MHLAAESHVDRSIDAPDEFLRTNVMGTFHLLQAARAYWTTSGKPDSFRFLHVSTDEVYGSLGLDDPPFTERTPYAPRSPYSASKAASDHLARAWHATYGLPVIVTHSSNNYGPYQHPEKLIPTVILKGLRGEPIPVYGRGENIRDWLHVDDHAAALHRVATRGRVGATYHIGGGVERSNIAIVRQICRILDDTRPPPPEWNIAGHAELITFVADRPGHDLRYAIDASRVREELDWSPAENFDAGLRQTVSWYSNNRAWREDILGRE